MKPTLVIIEDVRNTQKLLKAGLEISFDIQAIAESAAMGVEAIRHFAPKLALVDIVMPHHSGLDVLRTIKSGPMPHPKFVMLSGLSCEKIIWESYRAGASDYLFKPIDLKLITQVLLSL